MYNITMDEVKRSEYGYINFDVRMLGSLYGFIVGDALGVPVEFIKRDNLKSNPVTDMREYGTHRQPRGTWSDDSSMMLATMDAMRNYDSSKDSDADIVEAFHNGPRKSEKYSSVMNNFLAWKNHGEYTPHGVVFDIGNSTSRALFRYESNKNNPFAGLDDLYENGNGALMRILPVALKEIHGSPYIQRSVELYSRLTHGHIISIVACQIYSDFLELLYKFGNKNLAFKALCSRSYSSYQPLENLHDENESLNKSLAELNENFRIGKTKEENPILSEAFGRLLNEDFAKLSEEEIKSSGYVVDTLEACIWCLLTTDNYKDAVLKAVNLGDDTDTVAALTGGLAGFLYGFGSIPSEWLKQLQNVDLVSTVITKFVDRYKVEDFATKNSWKVKPFTSYDSKEINITVDLNTFINTILPGHIPDDMSDHWFNYCDDEYLYQIRSWTGIAINRAHYQRLGDKIVFDRLDWNNNHEEYGGDFDGALGFLTSFIEFHSKYGR